VPRPPTILITECLQNDFVRPIGRYETLPNLLHVGYEEARRLMGEDPAEGPVARTMRWAQREAGDGLLLIHIRDWHDADAAEQQAHLARFGPHCLGGSEGAAFAWPRETPGDAQVVDALTLNDFHDTELARIMEPHAGSATRVGLMGVWTEAKVTFLAYELRTRYPGFELAVCSALTASSSRARHFIALDQLERILGVRVIQSVGSFIEFLGGQEGADVTLPGHDERHPELEVSGEARLAPDDRRLLRYLFRDCRQVELRTLDGGYSGNVVLGSSSVDLHGHQQVPHVVKIGPRDAIGRERSSFERIEAVLGNSAPSVTDFADLGERGAIKYRYASMGEGFSTTFQKVYGAGAELSKVERILNIVFREQLGRLYAAGTLERCDLLEHYLFSPKWAPGVRRRVERLVDGPAGPRLSFPGGREAECVCEFYERHLDALRGRAADSCFMSYVHGDLNGANIVIDGQDNVWIIDFFHTARAHILKDLIKLENDLLYIFTPLASEEELEQALLLTDALVSVEDLAAALPELDGLTAPALVRGYQTLKLLRGFYPELVKYDRDPLQLLAGQLRYAVHTLGFEESSPLQKRWALYAACRYAEQVVERIQRRGPLRVDWLDREQAGGHLGLTLLPGRKDLGRDLAADLEALGQQQVSHVLCLVAPDELEAFGVQDLLQRYEEAGIVVRHLPMVDQRACSREEMDDVAAWLQRALAEKGRVMVHCVGGLGRSGTVAACYLRRVRGLPAEEALAAVRRARSPRAVESEEQEAFVRSYPE
jgi:protein-tyrosine phosphatase/nicotinamidase-related amidase